MQPAHLSPETQYAIDQFVMGGGKVLLFVDPDAEAGGMPVGNQDPGAAASSISLAASAS